VSTNTPGKAPTTVDGHKDLILEHEYDGIREYDNPIPSWFHLIFIATILISIPYYIYYETNSEVLTAEERVAREEVMQLRKQVAALGELSTDEPTLLKLMAEPKWLKVGASIYATNCASCHGPAGQGTIGPNMTDDHYKNLKTLAEIPKVVIEGANQGAMPAWRTRLSTNNIVLVSAYVASLRGQNLPSARPAEGEVIPPWPAPAAPAPTPAPKPAAGNASTGHVRPAGA